MCWCWRIVTIFGKMRDAATPTHTHTERRADNVNGNGVKSEHTQQTTCLTDQNSQNQKAICNNKHTHTQVQLCPIHICHTYCINDRRICTAGRQWQQKIIASERATVWRTHRKRTDRTSAAILEYGAFNYLFEWEPHRTDPTTQSSKGVLKNGDFGLNTRYGEQFNVCYSRSTPNNQITIQMCVHCFYELNWTLATLVPFNRD